MRSSVQLTFFFCQQALGIVCVGITGHKISNYNFGSSEEFFFLLMVTTFMIGTFILLVSCLASLSTASIISKTTYVSVLKKVLARSGRSFIANSLSITLLSLSFSIAGSPLSRVRFRIAARGLVDTAGACQQLQKIQGVRVVAGSCCKYHSPIRDTCISERRRIDLAEFSFALASHEILIDLHFDSHLGLRPDKRRFVPAEHDHRGSQLQRDLKNLKIEGRASRARSEKDGLYFVRIARMKLTPTPFRVESAFVRCNL